MSECAFCGHGDSRHRLLDSIHERIQAGEPGVLEEYGLTQTQLTELERQVYPDTRVQRVGLHPLTYQQPNESVPNNNR